MNDKKQNDEKTKNLDGFVTKREFYQEITPMKKDISFLKKDVSVLKIDVSELKEDVRDLHQDLRHTENKLLLEIRLSRQGSEDKMLKAMDKNNEFLITAMCEQTQKIVDHIDNLSRENKKEHRQMCSRISACENKLAIKS